LPSSGTTSVVLELKDGTDLTVTLKRLNINGQTRITEEKRARQEIQLITGDKGEQFQSAKKTIRVDINEINQSQYDELKLMWKDINNALFIRTERNEYFWVNFISPTLDLTPDEDYDGNTFYYGTIQLTE